MFGLRRQNNPRQFVCRREGGLKISKADEAQALVGGETLVHSVRNDIIVTVDCQMLSGSRLSGSRETNDGARQTHQLTGAAMKNLDSTFR
ncbi:MAG TPA: hypothetical protein VER76_21710 [Pyrinomonadaceae bacterium]|nr:hypothetical protein [Pyrinomonadaceae bacterium]